MCSLTSLVGRGSRRHVVGLESLINLLTDVSLRGWKEGRIVVHRATGSNGGMWMRSNLIRSILLKKNSAKSSASAVSEVLGGIGLSATLPIKPRVMEKSFFGSPFAAWIASEK